MDLIINKLKEYDYHINNNYLDHTLLSASNIEILVKLYSKGIYDYKSDHGGIVLFYVAQYYYFIEKNYVEAKKYCKIAIKEGNNDAANTLGLYYHFVSKKYSKATKYYAMAIETGNINAMNNLAYYYHFVLKIYSEAKKYYRIAIEKRSPSAMNNLGYYYHHTKQKYDKAVFYYEMAGNEKNALCNLGCYYEHVEQNYTKAIYYYKLACYYKHTTVIRVLWNHYFKMNNYKEAIKYYMLNSQYNGKSFDKLYDIQDDKILCTLWLRHCSKNRFIARECWKSRRCGT